MIDKIPVHYSKQNFLVQLRINVTKFIFLCFIKLDFGSTFDRFDADVSPHYHFICEKCGAVLDLHAIPVEKRLNSKVEKATGFKVSHHRTEFYGICHKCQPGSNRS